MGKCNIKSKHINYPRNLRNIHCIKIPQMMKQRMMREHCMPGKSHFTTFFKPKKTLLSERNTYKNTDIWNTFMDLE